MLRFSGGRGSQETYTVDWDVLTGLGLGSPRSGWLIFLYGESSKNRDTMMNSDLECLFGSLLLISSVCQILLKGVEIFQRIK